MNTSALAIAEEFKQYAYSVSHDLSGPVRAMVEFSKLLAASNTSSLDEENLEYLSLIIENGVKLQQMMDGMLSYSRLNTVAAPVALVSMNQVAKNCLLLLEAMICRNNASITMGELPTVEGNEEQLQQALTHLLSNALLYQPDGQSPKVEINAVPMTDVWVFTIRDNGIGLLERMQETIFNPFRRLHSDEDYPGIGMGLTLARKIIERHGGTLRCVASSPSGSTFRFTLPKAKGIL